MTARSPKRRGDRLGRLLWRFSLHRWRFERAQRRRQGTAEQAILFAVKIDDHYDRLEFLEGWLRGDLDAWPDYKPWLLPMPAPDDTWDADLRAARA